MSERISLFTSDTPEYRRSFEAFLAHTNQKDQARAWLDRLVDSLPDRRVFLDAGAGNGKVTAWYLDRFEQTIAIEPNTSLREDLLAAVPGSEVHSEQILDARPTLPGDLVLCSHVLYYIDLDAWQAHLKQLADWVSDTGVAAIALQNHETDCMGMLDHFFGQRYDLQAAAATFRAAHGEEFAVEVETVPALITTPDLETACVVAEFMLNLNPIGTPPLKSDVRDYVQSRFAQEGSGYQYSCHQDFLTIRRK